MAEDPRVDAYIAAAAPFAQPLLTRLRTALRGAAEGIDETIKWGMPAFTYKGAQIANIGAFKAHVTCNFWRREIVGAAGLAAQEGTAMGQFGRITSAADLPDDAAIAALVAAAIAQIDAGAKTPRAPKRARGAAPPMPDDFAAALAAAGATPRFAALPPGAQRDYLDWIVGAKRAATRARRIADAVAAIAQGRKRYWQYARS